MNWRLALFTAIGLIYSLALTGAALVAWRFTDPQKSGLANAMLPLLLLKQTNSQVAAQEAHRVSQEAMKGAYHRTLPMRKNPHRPRLQRCRGRRKKNYRLSCHTCCNTHSTIW